ncbi:hypothetical protein MSG28_015292 [Choristoneura fumiferana]|uniref:Uncharacterized protein n=1 Tax=Choristoneura fumiferana TaxID=7141 RepID=A0ACC0K9V3_CHOFU|nr:hypothetical protein MSG28_015292 [Choristoneura fumiferana]
MPQMFPGNFDLDADTEAHHEPQHETEVKLSCRFIMIGSYFFKPQGWPYFDPTSPDDAVNSIALLPVVLSRRHAAALRTLFGMVLDEPAACDARLRLCARAPRTPGKAEPTNS